MTGTQSFAATSALVMTPREFDRIRQIAYNFCGVDLTGKQILVSARLGKKIRSLNLASFTKYCDVVEGDGSGALFTEMIDALTTNHTSFFREVRHFEFLRNTVLPQMESNAPVRVWSSACSTGEEPYTIAFSVIEALGAAAYSRLSIMATDISTRVLDKADKGLYSVSSLDALSTEVRRECLLKGTGTYAGSCMVKPTVKELIEFRQWNLLHQSPSFGPFDIIFCRNVMIYFDQDTQQSVVDNLVGQLVPGGYLLIGHAESLNGIRHSLEYICTATYRKPAEAGTKNKRSQGMNRAGTR